MNYIMHFGIKGMKWRKKKTLAQQAESQARVAEGQRRAYDEARYAKQKADADLDREVDKHIRASKDYDSKESEYKKLTSHGRKAPAKTINEKRKAVEAAKAAKDQTQKRIYRSLDQQELASKNASYTYKKAINQPQPDRTALSNYRHKVQKGIEKYNSTGSTILRKLFGKGKNPSGKLVTHNKAVYRADKNQRMNYKTSKWVPKKKR